MKFAIYMYPVTIPTPFNLKLSIYYIYQLIRQLNP